MKIGIMTLWDAFDNYGQQLQVFSLQHFLRLHGKDAYIIRYQYKKDVRKKKWYEYFYTLKYIFDFNFIKLKLTDKKRLEKSKSIDRHFYEFAKKYITFSDREYRNIGELKDNPPEADFYITGSDQVWNYSDQYKPYSNKIQAFYLNFGDENIKRIAYAASFGKDKYGKALQKFVKPLLERFSFVTCREMQGINICKSMNIEGKLTLDPVFLNDKTEYLKLINGLNSLEMEQFCIVYLLGNSTVIDFDRIEQYAKEADCKIVFIPGKGFQQHLYKEYYPNPQEWLWYMYNAKFIITNSFHGTAFSILLNKNFSVLPLSGKNSLNQNDRIFTMLKLLEIDSRVIGLKENPVDINFNWKKIEQLIKNKNEEVGLLKFINQYEKQGGWK